MTDRPTGDELLTELRRAAYGARQPLKRYVAPLAPARAHLFIYQLERAGHPLPATVERVRALIAGKPIPPASTAKVGHHLPLTSLAGDPRLPGDLIAARRELTDRAHRDRRPGETLAAAIERLAACGQGIQP